MTELKSDIDFLVHNKYYEIEIVYGNINFSCCFSAADGMNAFSNGHGC